MASASAAVEEAAVVEAVVETAVSVARSAVTAEAKHRLLSYREDVGRNPDVEEAASAEAAGAASAAVAALAVEATGTEGCVLRTKAGALAFSSTAPSPSSPLLRSRSSPPSPLSPLSFGSTATNPTWPALNLPDYKIQNRRSAW